MTLIEVLFALVVLLVVLLPVAQMLVTGSKVIAGSRARADAASVVQRELTGLQQLAGAEGPAGFPPAGLPSSATTAPIWPDCSTASRCPTVTVAGTVFHAFVTGGWCVQRLQPGSDTGSWGDGTVSADDPPAYIAVTRAAWGPTAGSPATAAESVTDSAQLAGTGPTYHAPAAGTTVSSCPVGPRGLA